MDCCESHEATIQLNLWGVLHFWGCLGCSLLDLDVTVAWGFSFVTIEVHNFAPVTSPSCWISFLLNLFIRKHFPSQHIQPSNTTVIPILAIQFIHGRREGWRKVLIAVGRDWMIGWTLAELATDSSSSIIHPLKNWTSLMWSMVKTTFCLSM